MTGTPATQPPNAAEGQATRSGWRLLRRGIALLSVLLLALAAVGFFALGRVDLASIAATRATAALGREVKIESLRLSPGRWIGIELRGAQLANVAGGSAPRMVEIGQLRAELDPLSLLRGPAALRGVELDGFKLLLERGPNRAANWHFGPAGASGAPSAPDAPKAPDGRSGFPDLPSVTLRNSEILFRTSSGQALRTTLTEATILSPDPTQPATLRGAGSYNGTPVALEATLGPITVLRDASKPYPTLLRMRSGETTLVFDGTMTDPLNVDGATGRLTLHAPTPAALLAIAGVSAEVNAALDLAGDLRREGDLWRLSEARGRLNGAALTAPLLQLTEGSSGRPDSIVVSLDLARLDLNRMIGHPAAGGHGPQADLPLALDAHQDPLIEAKLGVRELIYAQMQARDVRLEGKVTADRIALDRLALDIAGAQVTAEAHAVPRGRNAAQVDAHVAMVAADLGTLSRAFGLHALPLHGPVEGRVAVAAQGATLNTAARQARVSAVVAMQGGSVDRRVIEIGSTDPRALLRTAEGTTPLTCLLGVLDMRAGVGEVTPLRLRAATGSLAGTAQFDLNRHTLDLVIGSQPETTHGLALDIPVRVHGSFANPSVGPARWSEEGRAQLEGMDNVAPLPPALRSFAQGNPCYRSTRQSR
jgi:uncharacterized protein involved in outer membrane biogenesis